MFKTQYDKHERVFATSGGPERILYTGEFDDMGRFDLVVSGKENVYMDIQSHADSVDIHVIMKQFENGDQSVLNRVQGMFADVTGMPTSYPEMLNTILKGEQTFMELPVEVREKFNHSFSEFIATIGTDAWNEKMSVQNPPVHTPAVDVKETVTDEP